MEESKHFYEDILGLVVMQDYADESKYINDVLGLSDGKIHMVKLKSIDGPVISTAFSIKY